MSKKQIAFITDSFSFANSCQASTIALMKHATRWGADVYWMESSDLHIQNNLPVAYMAKAHFLDSSTNEILMGDSFLASLNSLDQIWWRKSHLSSLSSQSALNILQLVSAETLLINEPATLRSLNENLFPLQFSAYAPESLVTSKISGIKAFVREKGPKVLLNAFFNLPQQQYFLLQLEDPNLDSLLQSLTQKETQAVLVQSWNPEQKHRTKRFFLVQGEVLEVVEQISNHPSISSSLERGARVQLTQASPKELEMIGLIGPLLRDKGILLATLDTCNEKMIGMNFSCPSGIEHLEALVPNIEWNQLFEPV